ncbi:hypothetical protein LSH36_659g00008 [Paralvinella palmiformis]|uniref:Uncharacterized protein n=1 Tax=Paralvinella palmiformis TaxID=53620 RepID=A0AAD9MWN3_9ANNE|nr:hypothetical protein LSH36_659g00008 [Paralvinella palmiformis]
MDHLNENPCIYFSDDAPTVSNCDQCDASYKPSNHSLTEASVEESIGVNFDEVAVNKDDDNKYVHDNKYIVFHHQLFDLFSCCPVCSGPSTGSMVKKVGLLIIVNWVCQENNCSFQGMW